VAEAIGGQRDEVRLGLVMQRAGLRGKPKLLYLVTEDWYFLSHRLPMAQAAQQAGYDVHVATRVKGRGSEIEGYGFHLHVLQWRRGSFNPVHLLSSVADVRHLYRNIRPDLVHHVALQPAIIGSIAAIGLPVICLNAIAGLGFAYTSASWTALLVRTAMARMLGRLFNRRHSVVLVQNPEDRDQMKVLGVAADRLFLIPGSGADTERMTPLPEPHGEATMAFVGRLLEDKGLSTLVAAQELLAARGRPVRLLIAGEPDLSNSSSIPESVIDGWRSRPGIEVLGHIKDIGRVWERAHIAVLPSRREGLPKSLLEAAAYGRPIVATNVAGCREIGRPGVNALLVPPDNVAALTAAIERLATDPALRQRLGAAGRALVEREFSDAGIGRQIVALYDRLLERECSSPGIGRGLFSAQ
jgi:glycosyltransferase involved in cell wall biosynthesis